MKLQNIIFYYLFIFKLIFLFELIYLFLNFNLMIMKKIIIMLLINILFSESLVAQLYIGNSNYVFDKGALVYVKGAVVLNSVNSKFYLRNEGQLLQGTTVASANKGLGVLSVFQEGTVNNYAYNYWCSPIGNPSTNAQNEDFGITMLNIPDSNISSTSFTPAAILPINSYDGISSIGSLSIAPYWIWRFLSSSTYSQWIQSASATNISPGQGFTMKGTNGSDSTNPLESTANNIGSRQRYDFRGKPNDGDIIINVANNKFTLTGNPYPSAIDLSAFLTSATNCTGVAYFWEQDKTVNSHILMNYRGGYGTFSPISRGGTGLYIPAKFYAYDGSGNQLGLTSTPNNSYARYFSPIGQGFMIQGNALGSTVTMKNSFRVFQKENISNSVFEKQSSSTSVNSGFLPKIESVSGFDYTTVTTDEVPHIRFNTLLNNEGIKQVALAFDQDATDGVDHAKDAKNPGDNNPMDMYFVLNNEEYIISVIQFDENKRLPVGFRSTTDANVKITVASIINFTQANDIFLYDKVTGIYHDIKNDQYEFQIPSGVINERYEITFRNDALTTTSSIKDNFFIVQNNIRQSLSIANPNAVIVKSVTLFDVLGKIIFDKPDLGNKMLYEFPTTSLSEGIYIIKLKTNDGQSISQKIIVEKNK